MAQVGDAGAAGVAKARQWGGIGRSGQQQVHAVSGLFKWSAKVGRADTLARYAVVKTG